MLTEISIFLPNNPGELAKLIELLNENTINIKGITAAETPDYGLLLILVDKPEKCIDLLNENKYDISATDVLAVKIPDDFKNDTLFDIANILGENKINIEYLYMTIVSNITLMIVRVDENEKAENILKNENYILIDIKDL